MEAVTEVGVENILHSDRESTPGSLPGLELEGYNTGRNGPIGTQCRISGPIGTQFRISGPIGTQCRIIGPIGTQIRIIGPIGT